ncbi:MAG: glutamine--scyllo-inositol aminotransferase [Desulfobacterales bacterium CG23_combo_of_CG06-09_8_20_14_all_52_9]|nr:MAG: glutamine--scyllo-inositol aminotransferase [Desulfobacterales bacterium CG23_combo_of_CG06-09_8_20_14_all_52_9]
MVQGQDLSRVKIRLSKPYFGDKQNLMTMIKDILERGFLVQGNYVAQFEKRVAEYLGVKQAVAVSSGTAALHIALVALGIEPGDEVIVPAYTFPATANVVELVGGEPVFVDIDLNTYDIQADHITKVISPRTKAIIPVHLFGNPSDMDPIMEVARACGLAVVEDAAGALGSEYKREKCGTIGTLGCFSFHPRKIITTGEGGMVITKDDLLVESLRRLRNHGMKAAGPVLDLVTPGFNYRLSETGAALGMSQVNDLQDRIRGRQKLAGYYKNLLEQIPEVSVQRAPADATVAWQAFVVRLRERENGPIIKRLKEKGIETTIGTYALHVLKYYQNKYHFLPSDYPNAAILFTECLALPFYNGMSMEMIDEIVKALKETLDENQTSEGK